MDPYSAYLKANKYGSSDETRSIVLESPTLSYSYAAFVDPYSAFKYAQDVDKGPRDDTRQAVTKSFFISCMYARYIDKCLHPVIKNAIKPHLLAGDPKAIELFEMFEDC